MYNGKQINRNNNIYEYVYCLSNIALTTIHRHKVALNVDIDVNAVICIQGLKRRIQIVLCIVIFIVLRIDP